MDLMHDMMMELHSTPSIRRSPRLREAKCCNAASRDTGKSKSPSVKCSGYINARFLPRFPSCSLPPSNTTTSTSSNSRQISKHHTLHSIIQRQDAKEQQEQPDHVSRVVNRGRPSLRSRILVVGLDQGPAGAWPLCVSAQARMS